MAHQNSLLLENARNKGQLRLAAVEQRIQAHQEAFALWRKLIGNVHEDTITKVVMECQEWFNNNCLYLSAEAREALSDAYFAAHMHSSLLADRSNPEAVKENWDKIMGLGAKIVQAAELPTLGERGARLIEKKEHLTASPSPIANAQQGQPLID